jgi:cephalosporin hydroxylase
MPDTDVAEAYHRWYYAQRLWEQVTWQGVPCLKSITDLWNYQEIIAELCPGLIVEFGTRHGGSALFFAAVGRLANPDCRVFTVDLNHTDLSPIVRAHPAIETHRASSIAPSTLTRLAELRKQIAGPLFVILDSDHRKAHVLSEMLALRDLLNPGDYLVVEDGNINGHPVLPNWGEGPWEALEDYMARFPNDFLRDEAREKRFGFTFAPRGYLQRQ